MLMLYLGGRGLNSATILGLGGRGVDPLGPENLLVFGVGPLVGTLVPGASRCTITAISPLTVVGMGRGTQGGGATGDGQATVPGAAATPATSPCFGDSNFGGFFGAELKYSGFDQVIVRGASEKPVYLFIRDEQVEIRDASHLWGLDTWECDSAIHHELGDEGVQIASIGPAGENLVRLAAIITHLSRAAAKCGIGAVMGSKNLKAVAVKGTGGVRVANADAMRAAFQDAVRTLSTDPWSQQYSRDGTPSLIESHQKLGRLATLNYQRSQFDGWKSLSATSMWQYWNGSRACFSCPLHCSHSCNIDEGPYAGACGEGPEYVTIAGFGSKLGNADTESILMANTLCNRLGLDTMNTASTIAWAMEAWQKGILDEGDTNGRVMEWGGVRAILDLLPAIAHRQDDFSRLLGEGAYRAAQAVGRGSSDFVIHSKGQDPGLSDPRAAPAWGLGYAVASRGGCHLRGLPTGETFFTPDEAVAMFGTAEAVMPHGTVGKGRLVKWSEDQRAAADSLGICKFIVRTALMYPEWEARFFRVVTGIDMSPDEVMRAGERAVNVERAFNVLQGLTKADDTLCRRFLEEPITSGPSQGHVVNLAPMLDEYYEARGWDVATGYPKREVLESLGLKEVVCTLEHVGRLCEQI